MRECCRMATTSPRALIHHLDQVLETVSELELAVVSDLVKVAVLDQAEAVTSVVETVMTVVADQAVAAVATTPKSLLEKTSRPRHVWYRSPSRSTLKTRGRT